MTGRRWTRHAVLTKKFLRIPAHARRRRGYPMSEPGSPLIWLRDPRLLPLAASALPSWLWSIDGTCVLWANAAGAAIFGAPSSAALNARKFDLSHPAAAEVARLAATLPSDGAPR